MDVLIEVSARHVHLSSESLSMLFGSNYELTVKKELSQPGQFLSNERVEIVGPRSSIKNVSILCPLRNQTQIEISKTDARLLGINAPIRESGFLQGTPGCKIVGPTGEIFLDFGVIVAQRHIHLSKKDAIKLNCQNGQALSIKIPSQERALIFENVLVRINDEFSTVVHIDTDEANAANIKHSINGKILNTSNL